MSNSKKDFLNKNYENLTKVSFDRTNSKYVKLEVPMEIYKVMYQNYTDEKLNGVKTSFQDYIIRRYLVGEGVSYNPSNKKNPVTSIRER